MLKIFSHFNFPIPNNKIKTASFNISPLIIRQNGILRNETDAIKLN